MSIRVVVANDQPVVRTGFAMILDAQSDIAVVGQAEDGERAVELGRWLRPDVVLMDIRMPRMDGIEATRRLLGSGREDGLRVLVLTTFDLDDYVYAALRAGASGFLLKDATGDELVGAVRVVAAGDGLLAPSVTRRLIREFARQGRPAPDGAALDGLSGREREVLGLVARGMSNAEIAVALAISEHTVKTHVAHLLGKLDLRDRVQAVVFAYEAGLVRPAQEDPAG